jgi:hypothetical protein
MFQLFTEFSDSRGKQCYKSGIVFSFMANFLCAAAAAAAAKFYFSLVTGDWKLTTSFSFTLNFLL